MPTIQLLTQFTPHLLDDRKFPLNTDILVRPKRYQINRILSARTCISRWEHA